MFHKKNGFGRFFFSQQNFPDGIAILRISLYNILGILFFGGN